jgi:hypothetical protein
MSEAELLAELARRGIEASVVDGRLRLRGRGRKPEALIAEALRREGELSRLLQQQATMAPSKVESTAPPSKELFSEGLAAQPPYFPEKNKVVQPCSHAATPKTQPADGAVQRLWWPSWAEAFRSRLEAAGLEPRLVVSKGHRGEPVLSVEATCPSCGWVGGLVAWPLSVGTMAGRCRAGCRNAEVFQALDRRLERK